MSAPSLPQGSLPINLPAGFSVTPSYDGETISLIIEGLPCGQSFVLLNYPGLNGFAVAVSPVGQILQDAMWTQTLPPCAVP